MRALVWLVVGALCAPAVLAEDVDVHITTSPIPVFKNKRSGRMTQIIQNYHEERMLRMQLDAMAAASTPTPPATGAPAGAQPPSRGHMVMIYNPDTDQWHGSSEPHYLLLAQCLIHTPASVTNRTEWGEWLALCLKEDEE